MAENDTKREGGSSHAGNSTTVGCWQGNQAAGGGK